MNTIRINSESVVGEHLYPMKTSTLPLFYLLKNTVINCACCRRLGKQNSNSGPVADRFSIEGHMRSDVEWMRDDDVAF